jgi:hypothetical protein
MRTLEDRCPDKTVHAFDQTKNAGQVLSTSSAVLFMTTSKQNRFWLERRPNIKSTNAFRTMNLMSTHRNQVSIELLDFLERFFSKPLYCIGMECNSFIPTDLAKQRNRLERTDLVIGGHDGNKHGVWPEGISERIRIHEAFRRNWEASDLESLFLLEVIKALKDSVMLDGGGNQVTASILEESGCTENSQVIAFRTATREDHLTRFAPPNAGKTIAGVIQNDASLSAEVMDTGRVCVDLMERREHGLTHMGIQWSCGVVIEVNRSH